MTQHPLDATDNLRNFRDEFVIDDPDLIYLDGNSLGRLPKRTIQTLETLIKQEWGNKLVGGWNNWIDLPQRLGAKIARLIGAQPDEVLLADSTTVNLYKLTLAALTHQAPKTKIVSDEANFPSDLYVLSGLSVLSKTEIQVTTTNPEQEIDDQTALLTLSHTAFKTGEVYDLKKLTQKAHENQALVLWDLSHSIGALPVDLNACQADLAVGCCYKYICGGPGAPAFLYVRRDLQQKLNNPIQGWFGHKSAFDFRLDYEPANNLNRFLSGTPPILSMAAIEPALDLLFEAGIDSLRAKSINQTQFLIDLIDEHLPEFELITPREADKRGSHVSIAHPHAWQITQSLIQDHNLIPDFRAPNVLRLGITPLTTTYQELEEAIKRIKQCVETKTFEKHPKARARVT